MNICSDIIILGPMGAGKSSLTKSLTDITGIPALSVDILRYQYYRDLGANLELGEDIYKKQGSMGLYNYFRPYRIPLLEKVLLDFKGHIFDFGAEDLVAETQEELITLQKILNSYPNVFLLLPNQSVQECMFTLLKRPGADLQHIELNRHFLENGSYGKIAKHTLIRDNRSTQDISNQVLKLSEDIENLSEQALP